VIEAEVKALSDILRRGVKIVGGTVVILKLGTHCDRFNFELLFKQIALVQKQNDGGLAEPARAEQQIQKERSIN
jgi:hypothetical protein